MSASNAAVDRSGSAAPDRVTIPDEARDPFDASPSEARQAGARGRSRCRCRRAGSMPSQWRARRHGARPPRDRSARPTTPITARGGSERRRDDATAQNRSLHEACGSGPSSRARGASPRGLAPPTRPAPDSKLPGAGSRLRGVGRSRRSDACQASLTGRRRRTSGRSRCGHRGSGCPGPASRPER